VHPAILLDECRIVYQIQRVAHAAGPMTGVVARQRAALLLIDVSIKYLSPAKMTSKSAP
jgi:hypothetical protein